MQPLGLGHGSLSSRKPRPRLKILRCLAGDVEGFGAHGDCNTVTAAFWSTHGDQRGEPSAMQGVQQGARCCERLARIQLQRDSAVCCRTRNNQEIQDFQDKLQDSVFSCSLYVALPCFAA